MYTINARSSMAGRSQTNVMPQLADAHARLDRIQRDAIADGCIVIRSGGGRLAVRNWRGAVVTYTVTRAGR